MVKRRKKKRFAKKVFGIRGGSIPGYIKTPLVKELQKVASEKASPKKVTSFVEKVIDKAAGGRSSTASRILKELAKPIGVKVADGIMKMADPPTGGVLSPETVAQPFVASDGVKRISGSNGLYIAREHKVKFSFGPPPGQWLRDMARLGGTNKKVISDTSVDYPLTELERANLNKTYGLNQKLNLAVSTNHFGFTRTDLLSLLDLNDITSSKLREQSCYASISSLNSNVTITSLNKYVPCYVKLYLCRLKVTKNEWDKIVTYTANTFSDPTVQLEGHMPVYLQQSTISDKHLGESVLVDPKSKGIRSADIWDASVEVVQVKKVKLSAGDRVKVSYQHKTGSGIRVDKLHGMLSNTNFAAEHPITYCLMVEAWGEEVDAHTVAATTNVIKGTCPGALQFEFDKSISGSRVPSLPGSAINTGPNQGYLSSHYAIKVYNKDIIESTTARRYNADYSQLGSLYEIPLMSAAYEVEAGTIT